MEKKGLSLRERREKTEHGTLDGAEMSVTHGGTEEEQPESSFRGAVNRIKNWSETSMTEMKTGQDVGMAGRWWVVQESYF